jgi:subtilase family serine protease
MPAYQYQTAIPGLVNAHSQTSSTCTGSGRYLRQVPDVAADADPYTGYVVNWDGYWQTIAGTSAAAPLWAAIAALTDASPFCAAYGSGNAGVLPQGLYAAVAAEHSCVYSGSPHQALNDVTSGNDDYIPSGCKGGLYPAGTGFDEATGLGVPRVSGLTSAGKPSNYYPGLTALMCRYYRTKLKSTTVTSISPAKGKPDAAVKVTVHGTGFLPVSGAGIATVGTTQVPASCPSATECTLTVPQLKKGTDAIRISAEDGPASAVTTGSKYTCS